MTAEVSGAQLWWIDWLVGWFYGLSTLFGSFNAKLSQIDKSLKQLILEFVHFLVYTQLYVKTLIFQTAQFSINTQFKHSWI